MRPGLFGINLQKIETGQTGQNVMFPNNAKKHSFMFKPHMYFRISSKINIGFHNLYVSLNILLTLFLMFVFEIQQNTFTLHAENLNWNPGVLSYLFPQLYVYMQKQYLCLHGCLI